MKCLCGKRRSYPVTSSKTSEKPSRNIPSDKPNGAIRGPVSPKPSITHTGNAEPPPLATVLELPHDDASRYSDISKKLTQEYNQTSAHLITHKEPHGSSKIDEKSTVGVPPATEVTSASIAINGDDREVQSKSSIEEEKTGSSEPHLDPIVSPKAETAFPKSSSVHTDTHETTSSNALNESEVKAEAGSSRLQINGDLEHTGPMTESDFVEPATSHSSASKPETSAAFEEAASSTSETEANAETAPSKSGFSAAYAELTSSPSQVEKVETTFATYTETKSVTSETAHVEVIVSSAAFPSTATPEVLQYEKESNLLAVPSPTSSLSRSSSVISSEIAEGRKESVGELLTGSVDENEVRRRSGVQVSVPKGIEVTADEELPIFPKSPEDEESIKKAIEKNEFLSKILTGKRLNDIINSMQLRNVAAKKTLIKQGEKGSEMFVSKEGRFKILVKGKVVGEFNDIRVFGELAILYNAKRLATIQAVTAGQVWVLDRHVYQKIYISSNLKEQDENLSFLKNVESLNVVSLDLLRQVSNLLKPEFFTSGTVIIRQGDKGDKFYIIRAGTVTISKTGQGVLGTLGKGKCFGEMALQKEDTRQATVTAEAPGVECLTLTRRDFIDHFGDVEIPKIEARRTSAMEEIQSEYQDIKLEDLKIIRTLGVGGFGRVELVQHKKQKNKVFALKYLKKMDIVYQGQQEHVYNEKIIQMNCRSLFIARLYRTYKDNKYVYFLVEACLGGDLFYHLHKQKGKRFEEKDAKFLSACVIEALEHLHSKDVVYRDLKPENLLVDKNGYLKLTDFGFAKKMPPRGKTFTFAGTPEYVAPEIVLNRGHDRAVDYWAFGVFVFELLTGRTPFRTGDSSHMRTYNKILNGIDNVNFPTYVNPKARNLIEKLCRPMPAERLGMQRGGPRDIKAHKWYQGFDWPKFQQGTVPSPLKPKLKDVTDTSNFDVFKQDKDYPPDETSGWDVYF